MAEPEVTVVIPTRSRWDLLSQTLRGAFGQEDVELEVIVVDDGSTDETPARLAALADPRLHVLRNDHSQGVARARNRGIAEARGAWVAFLDDDDLWSPRKLRSQLDAAESQGADWVYGAAVMVDERRRALRRVPAPDPREVPRLLMADNVVPAGPSNVAARADLVRHVGSFDERLGIIEDWDLWIGLSTNGDAAACPEVLVAYVLHSRNAHTQDPARVLSEIAYMARKQAAAGRTSEAEFGARALPRWRADLDRSRGQRGKAARTYLAEGFRRRDPGLLARAAGALMGERFMKAARRALARPRVHRPAWLGLYPSSSERPHES